MPPTEIYISFAVVAMLLVTSPGPNLFLLLKTTPIFGRAAGLANTFGFSFAILSHALLSIIGVGAIIATSALAFSILKIIGATYLMWLGFKALRTAWNGAISVAVSAHGANAERNLPKNLGMRFAEGYLTNMLNPKAALFYLAAFPQFLTEGGHSFLIQGMVLSSMHATIAILWHSLVVLGIATISRWMKIPKVWRWLQATSGTALVALGGRLLLLRQVG